MYLYLSSRSSRAKKHPLEGFEIDRKTVSKEYPTRINYRRGFMNKNNTNMIIQGDLVELRKNEQGRKIYRCRGKIDMPKQLLVDHIRLELTSPSCWSLFLSKLFFYTHTGVIRGDRT